ncbi:MAG: heat-inducible transcriptional repressor HrcA [Sphaerobacter sp.]|nr:heat-inducible transcriptional repressor HrcA [Sphaerobacter sp.]
MQPQLSRRQSTILKLIVQEYIRTGRAVGSKSLLERYDLGVSPATVRSEMGELEEQQFLAHPHTSAGRVPTDRGYRYYVEYLLDDTSLPVPEQITIRHQFRQVEAQVESWAKLAAAVLADLSGNLSLVTPPRSSVERMRHFELISLRSRVVLLITVTQAGTVREVILPLTEEIGQEQLSALSQRLNPLIRDLTHEQIRRLAEGAGDLPGLVLHQIADVLRLAEQEAQSEVIAEGLDYVLQQPELGHGALAQRLLELLRGGAILSVLIPQLKTGEGVQVIIGTENRAAELHPFAVVLASYGARGHAAGFLGIIGPTRMRYGRSISTVRYVSQVMTDLLRDIYETDDEERSHHERGR